MALWMRTGECGVPAHGYDCPVRLYASALRVEMARMSGSTPTIDSTSPVDERKGRAVIAEVSCNWRRDGMHKADGENTDRYE